jgi:hypothetical protein
MFTPSNYSKKAQLEEEDGGKTTSIGNNLDQAQEDALVNFVIKNQDMFAWKPSNMSGTPRESWITP